MKIGFKNKREMRSGISNHLCSPNWHTAPILVNDFLELGPSSQTTTPNSLGGLITFEGLSTLT